MRYLKSGLIAASLCLSVTACSGATLYNQDFQQNYNFAELMANHGGKDMKLQVIGDPYGMNQADLAKVIADAITNKNQGQPIRFTTTPEETAAKPTRMVLLLDPAKDAIAQSVCAGTAPRDPGSDGHRAILAYCKRDQPLSSTTVALPAGAKPGSKGFADALALAVNTITPLQNPYDKPQGCLLECS